MKLALALLCLAMIIGQSSCQRGTTNTSQQAFESANLRRQELPWERIAFKEIEERLTGSGVESLREMRTKRDAAEVRIWVGFDTVPLQGLILRKDESRWRAFYLSAERKPGGEDWVARELDKPENGWDALWSRLDRLRFLDLPDATEIGMEHKYLDMTNVVVELSYKGNYRTYHLFGLDVPAEQKHEAVRSIKEACDLLSKEFKVAVLWRGPF